MLKTGKNICHKIVEMQYNIAALHNNKLINDITEEHKYIKIFKKN